MKSFYPGLIAHGLHPIWINQIGDVGNEETAFGIMRLLKRRGRSKISVTDTLAEWLRRCPAKAMGSVPREFKSLRCRSFFLFSYNILLLTINHHCKTHIYSCLLE